MIWEDVIIKRELGLDSFALGQMKDSLIQSRREHTKVILEGTKDPSPHKEYVQLLENKQKAYED